MAKLRFLILLAMLFVVQPASAVLADQMTLANGDRISGEILTISENKVRIATEYAGEITIDFAGVNDLSTEKPARIILKNGDKISGRVESLENDRMMIRSDVLGAIEVPRALFSSLHTGEIPEADSADLARTRDRLQQAEVELIETKEELARKEQEMTDLTSIEKLWSGKFSVGATAKSGNTDTLDLRIDTTTTRKAPREELRLKFYVDYGETDNVTDSNEIFGEAKLKVFQTERRYLFGVTSMEFDEMENLDLRAQGFAGVGYEFIKEEGNHLLGEIGAGLTGEFYDENGNEETLEASLWLNAEWTRKLFERAEFFQGLTFYPSLSEFGDYRLRSETTLATPLSEKWAMKLSIIDDYDSDPESEDVERNDLQFVSSLEYTF